MNGGALTCKKHAKSMSASFGKEEIRVKTIE
jgi:hypothetical protein